MATTAGRLSQTAPAEGDIVEAAYDQRGETPLQKLDRNTVELVSELRVAQTGIQVLFAFLLVVPFNARFGRVSAFDRDVYFVTLLFIAIAAALLIAPSIHHRVLFRRGQKAYLVQVGNRLMIVGMAFLTVGMTGIMVLIGNVIFGTVTAIVVGVATATLLGGLWFAVPLNRCRQLRG